MTDEEKLIVGKYQLRYFSACQYSLWRIALVKSIKHILENADEFYIDLKHQIKQPDDETGDKTIHNEIKNGLHFEALAQSIQAIEDLFSLIKNAVDIPNFIKNVIVYPASKVKEYIWNFDTNNLQYVMEQMQLCYFPLNETWENLEAFEVYKSSVLLIQAYLEKMIAHHKNFYLHYNQYKHGQAIALRPFANPPEIPEIPNNNMLEASLMSFDSWRFDKRNRNNAPLQSMMIPHFHPAIIRHARELHDSDSLLRADLKIVHIDNLVEITEMAYTLLNSFWANLINLCETSEQDIFLEQYFPIKDYSKLATIGFPKSE